MPALSVFRALTCLRALQGSAVDIRAWLVEATDMLTRASEDGGHKAQEAVREQLLERDKCASLLCRDLPAVARCMRPTAQTCKCCAVDAVARSISNCADAIPSMLIQCGSHLPWACAARSDDASPPPKSVSSVRCHGISGRADRLQRLPRYLVVANRNATGLAARFRDLAGLQLLLLNEVDSMAAGRAKTLPRLQRLTADCDKPTDDFILQVNCLL